MVWRVTRRCDPDVEGGAELAGGRERLARHDHDTQQEPAGQAIGVWARCVGGEGVKVTLGKTIRLDGRGGPRCQMDDAAARAGERQKKSEDRWSARCHELRLVLSCGLAQPGRPIWTRPSGTFMSSA